MHDGVVGEAADILAGVLRKEQQAVVHTTNGELPSWATLSCVMGEGSKTTRPYRSRPLERYPSLRYRSESYERYPLLAITARDVSSGIGRSRYHSTYCKQ